MSPVLIVNRSKVFLFGAALSFLLIIIDAHGMLCTPRQRGAYVSDNYCGSKISNPQKPAIDYCPHCSNGGGLCGKSSLMLGGSLMPYAEAPIVAEYKSGEEIDFSVQITAHHNGHMVFHLCDLDACGTRDIDYSCFQKKKCYKLARVKKAECENPNIDTSDTCGPIDQSYPKRWYLPCYKSGGSHVGSNMYGGSDGSMRFKLPEGVTCKHCVIQWQWWSANACHAPGVVDYFQKYNPFQCKGGESVYSANLEKCEVPEEFAACADVIVSATAGNNHQGPEDDDKHKSNEWNGQSKSPIEQPVDSKEKNENKPNTYEQSNKEYNGRQKADMENPCENRHRNIENKSGKPQKDRQNHLEGRNRGGNSSHCKRGRKFEYKTWLSDENASANMGGSDSRMKNPYDSGYGIEEKPSTSRPPISKSPKAVGESNEEFQKALLEVLKETRLMGPEKLGTHRNKPTNENLEKLFNFLKENQNAF